MINQTKFNNLNYSIDSTFNKVLYRLFVFSFENEDNKTYFFSSITHQELK